MEAAERHMRIANFHAARHLLSFLDDTRRPADFWSSTPPVVRRLFRRAEVCGGHKRVRPAHCSAFQAIAPQNSLRTTLLTASSSRLIRGSAPLRRTCANVRTSPAYEPWYRSSFVRHSIQANCNSGQHRCSTQLSFNRSQVHVCLQALSVTAYEREDLCFLLPPSIRPPLLVERNTRCSVRPRHAGDLAR
ncbi:hypothetical protein WJX77_000163 [Trebouxia sp. C0004]